MNQIGLLHPGQMGSAVGRSLADGGHVVAWASQDRSQATRRRAEAAGLVDARTVVDVANQSELIVSVCPPHAALVVAQAVASSGFGGCYLDVNAISPITASSCAALLARSGASFVDGGIIGAPPSERGTTRIYLSGPDADRIAALFEGSVFGVTVLGEKVGQASALKACYAGWAKTANALLLAVRAAARHYRVEETLLAEWRISQPDLESKSRRAAEFTAPRSWRYVGEMKEHVQTFDDAGVPSGFHAAAADVFARLAAYKDLDSVSMDAVLDAIGLNAIPHPDP